jgi:hypothetical protein
MNFAVMDRTSSEKMGAYYTSAAGVLNGPILGIDICNIKNG